MATAPTIAAEEPVFSSNDSHMHINPDAKARREKLGLVLKAGETDEVEAAGPHFLCKVCYPNGDGPPPERPSNKTYDRSLEIAEASEKEALKAKVAELSEYIDQQRALAKAKPANNKP